MTDVGLVGGESVIDASWQYEQVVLVQLHAHPLIVLAPHIKVSLTVPNVANFLVLVQVLVEEHLDLILVDIAHLLGRHKYLVPVLVPALSCQLIDTLQGREMIVKYTEFAQVIDRDLAARIVGQTLVTLTMRLRHQRGLYVALVSLPVLTGRLSYM